MSSGGSSTLLRATREFEDDRNLIDRIGNVWDPDGTPATISSYDYINDTLGRRESVVNSGAAFDDDAYTVWDYNGRSELTESHRHLGSDPANYATDPKVEAEFLDFEYDPIGNRKTHSVGFTTPLESTYTAGELNQYRIIGTELPEVAPLLFYDADGNLIGTADLIPADMNCDGLVGFDDIDPFVLALSGCGGYDEQYPYCDCLNADIDGDGDGDVDFDDLNMFVAQMGENGYRQVFTWDAENRLTSVGPHSGNTETGDIKVDFTYDYLSRRVSKTVSTYNGSAWQVTEQLKYVWDGWKLLMELEENAQQEDDVMRKYTWGLDLAGQNGSINSLEGAGTIGGLLATYDTAGTTVTTDDRTFLYTYDANGNVGQLVETTAGANYGDLAVKYEYSPYGSRVNTPAQGEYEQPFRFSTKRWDDETGLGYWGLRYYNPTLGRWMSRDPIGEWGGENLYRYADGNPTLGIDPYGLLSCSGSGIPTGSTGGVDYLEMSLLPWPSGDLRPLPLPDGETDTTIVHFPGWVEHEVILRCSRWCNTYEPEDYYGCRHRCVLGQRKPQQKEGLLPCPAGKTRVDLGAGHRGICRTPNNPRASTNGCSIVPDAPGDYDFTAACNAHDQCYATKGKTKSQCDREFYADMLQICASYNYGAGNDDCVRFARLYYRGVRRLGHGAYRKAQGLPPSSYVTPWPVNGAPWTTVK